MRTETKLIKKILLKFLSEADFKLQYREAKSYYESSDKVIVYTNVKNIDDIIKYIGKYTSGIGIYKYGNMSTVSGKFNAIIIDIDTDELFEPDALEFIEVKATK